MSSAEQLPPQRNIDLSAYEKNQRKRTLSRILVIVMVAAAIFGGLNLFFYNSQEPAIVFFLVAFFCIPTLWLNLRDHYELSGLVTAFLVFLMAHYNLMDGAGIRDPGVVAYPLIVLVGGLLFGKQAIPIFTLTGITSLVIVVGMEASFNADIDRLFIISVILLAGAGATRAVLENTENNISRLKESEENLLQALEQTHKHAQRINDIIETVPEGVLLLNGIHQIILANRTAQDFLELLAPGHLRNVPLEQLGPLKQIGQISVDELIRNDKDTSQEIVIEEPKRIFEAAVRQVQNVPVPYENWVLVLRDATLERKQQETIQEQERMAVVGQLASGIAHDFRNILSVISIYSQIVDKKPQVERQQEYSRVIQEQVKDAAHLIEQILDFGRRTIMQRRALDIVVLVEYITRLLKRTLPSNIAIQFIYDPGSYIIHADRGRLQQAFVNLAVNARDAMPDGGKLTFSLTRDGLPAKFVNDPEYAGQDWLMIQISDTGEGINPEDIDHIFEPFYTTKKADKGTGLGLAQVYGIVKQHEGDITVHSERGKGTTFTLYFPTIPDIPAAPVTEDSRETKITKEVKILLVEDNPLTRTSTEEMLTMLGCKVVTAENGQEALQLYTSQLDKVDLVISDIVMPEMSGVDLFQALRTIAPQIKFLVVTGYPLNHQARELLEQGYIDWIEKPYQAEEMAGKISSLVGTNLKPI